VFEPCRSQDHDTRRGGALTAPITASLNTLDLDAWSHRAV